jgi:hypothetical protein
MCHSSGKKKEAGEHDLRGYFFTYMAQIEIQMETNDSLPEEREYDWAAEPRPYKSSHMR